MVFKSSVNVAVPMSQRWVESAMCQYGIWGYIDSFQALSGDKFQQGQSRPKIHSIVVVGFFSQSASSVRGISCACVSTEVYKVPILQ